MSERAVNLWHRVKVEWGARGSLWGHAVFEYIIAQTCSIPKLEPRDGTVGGMEGRHPQGNLVAHSGTALL